MNSVRRWTTLLFLPVLVWTSGCYTSAISYLNDGEEALKRGDNAKALQFFERSAKLNDERPYAETTRELESMTSIALLRLGRTQEAINHCVAAWAAWAPFIDEMNREAAAGTVSGPPDLIQSQRTGSLFFENPILCYQNIKTSFAARGETWHPPPALVFGSPENARVLAGGRSQNEIDIQTREASRAQEAANANAIAQGISTVPVAVAAAQGRTVPMAPAAGSSPVVGSGSTASGCSDYSPLWNSIQTPEVKQMLGQTNIDSMIAQLGGPQAALQQAQAQLPQMQQELADAQRQYQETVRQVGSGSMSETASKEVQLRQDRLTHWRGVIELIQCRVYAQH